MSENLPAAGPNRRWRLGAYEFELYTSGPQRWRWGCVSRGRGVSGHRTPVGAFIALRRWMRVPARPS